MNASISKLYEIIWLLLSVGLFGLASYEWFQRGFFEKSYQFYGLSLLAFLFYVFRKTKRQRDEAA